MEFASLFCFPIILLENTSIRTCWLTDSNVSKVNIGFLAWDTVSDTNYKADLNREAIFYVTCYGGS